MAGVSPLNAQERVSPGDPFLADTLGWFFTDAQVQDIARDAERTILLEERIEAMEALLALKDAAIEQERENVERALEMSDRSFWQDVPPVVWYGLGALTIALLRE